MPWPRCNGLDRTWANMRPTDPVDFPRTAINNVVFWLDNILFSILYGLLEIKFTTTNHHSADQILWDLFGHVEKRHLVESPELRQTWDIICLNSWSVLACWWPSGGRPCAGTIMTRLGSNIYIYIYIFIYIYIYIYIQGRYLELGIYSTDIFRHFRIIRY